MRLPHVEKKKKQQPKLYHADGHEACLLHTEWGKFEEETILKGW